MAFSMLSDKFKTIIKNIKGQGIIRESNIEQMLTEIKISLLEADVNYIVVKQFINNIKEKSLGLKVENHLNPGEKILQIIKEELIKLLGDQNQGLKLSNFDVIMLCGLQGSGKTTTSAKLAKYYEKKGKKRPLLVALDVYRPKAIEQLTILGEQNSIPVYKNEEEKNVLKIAKEAIEYAKENKRNLVIFDTAGRLHVDDNLMNELESLNKEIKIDHKLLVIDAMSGQDAVNVAKSFDDKLSLDGIIMSKLDSDARGGSALSIKHLTNLNIKFSGTGEKIDDFEFFYPDRMAERILGMGDILTLIEQAEDKLDKQEAEKAAKKMLRGNFDLEDMLVQMEQMNKLGSIKGVMRFIPGMPKITDEDALKAEKELIKTKAIINSMTKEERKNPEILKADRKRRISAGSGMLPHDVNKVLNQHEQMKQMMKQMKGLMGNKTPF